MSKEETLRLQPQIQSRLLGKNLLNSVQPMRELLELNLKTLQNFSYMKPEQIKILIVQNKSWIETSHCCLIMGIRRLIILKKHFIF